MKKNVTCKRCGQSDLVWAKSKAGNFYLADPDYVEFGEKQHKLIAFAHKCLAKSDLPKSFKEVQIKEKQALIKSIRESLEADIPESDKEIFRSLLNLNESDLKELEAK